MATIYFTSNADSGAELTRRNFKHEAGDVMPDRTSLSVGRNRYIVSRHLFLTRHA